MNTEQSHTTTPIATADLRERIIAALKSIYDPEIPVDIYELGLIYEISIFPVNNVHILMTLTSPSCPSAEVIPSEVKEKVRQVEGVSDVNVEITWDPPYSQDMMSEAAKLELGFL
jgi:FeS assembly SUF system protein